MTQAASEAGVQTYVVQVVGTARGNPGLAGAGIVVVAPDGVIRDRIARYLGSATAPEAQLQALALALRYTRPLAPAALDIALSNETVVRQVSGELPMRHPAIIRGMAELSELLMPFSTVAYRLGSDEEMAEAQRLADLGIDTRLRPLPAYDRPLPS